jgi:serine/threonine protein kinase
MARQEGRMSKLPPNAEFGNYQIVGHIASGGMAQIYLAKVRGLAGFEKHLALKVINAEYADEDRFIQMLIDEAKITVGLSHVNIGQVFDLGQVDGIYYIAMEYVDGIDVLELVNGLHSLRERVPIEAVSLIGRQICSGLHYAHTRKDKHGAPLNIVHRDVSPQNILVSTSGEIKVVDFGIAKAAGVSSKTQAGVIKGKVHYMAPEQAMGQKADSRSDIFSCGIVLWEMLTSQMVYAGDNVRELVDRVRLAKIPRPSTIRKEIPEELEQIVMKALTANPEERYQSAHEVQIDLTKFLSAYAPEFSASHLAALVERVLAFQGGKTERVEKHLSKEDMIRDVHSVIAHVPGMKAPPDKPYMLVDTGKEQKVHLIGDELIIGRAGQLVIADARVSRRHSRVWHKDDSYIIEDLGSSNGTFVNNLRITAPHTLEKGDHIRIGSYRMVLRIPSPPQEAQQEQVLQSVPKLIITIGSERVEKVLDGEQDIAYTVQVGPVRLSGVAGRVTRKQGAFWLEPVAGRQRVTINGSEPPAPVQLSPGDHFKVGDIDFEFCLQAPVS